MRLRLYNNFIFPSGFIHWKKKWSIKRVSTINSDLETWILLLNDFSHRLFALLFQHSELLTSAKGQSFKLSCQESILKAVQMLHPSLNCLPFRLCLLDPSENHLFLKELFPNTLQIFVFVNSNKLFRCSCTVIENFLKYWVVFKVFLTFFSENEVLVDFFGCWEQVVCRVLSLNWPLWPPFALQMIPFFFGLLIFFTDWSGFHAGWIRLRVPWYLRRENE